jgi:hypothetical protein
MQGRSVAVVASLVCCSACAIADISQPEKASTPDSPRPGTQASVEPHIPAGYVAQLVRWADLDADGDTDAAVVARPASDLAPRMLLILGRRPDGSFDRLVASANAVPPVAGGGMLGDPLRGIDTRTGGFTLRLEGGSRELWSRAYRFDFSRTARTWLLSELAEKVADRNNGVAKETRKTHRDFGNVPIQQFDVLEIP